MKTKLQFKAMEWIKRKVGMSNYLVVNPVGKEGGLMMLWSNFIELEITNCSNYHIHAKIHEWEGKSNFFLTGFMVGQKQMNEIIRGALYPELTWRLESLSVFFEISMK